MEPVGRGTPERRLLPCDPCGPGRGADLATVGHVKSGGGGSRRQLLEERIRPASTATRSPSGALADLRGLTQGGPGNHVRAPERGGAGRHARRGVPLGFLAETTFLPTPAPSPASNDRPTDGKLVLGGRRRCGRACSAMTRPPFSMGYLQRSGSKGTWSLTMAKATRLARCPKAQATVPGCFPRASSSRA